MDPFAARWGDRVRPWEDRVQALRVAFALEAADLERSVLDVAEAFAAGQAADKEPSGWN